MKKIKSLIEAVREIKDGDILHIGGFYNVGTPDLIIDEIITQGRKDLTVVTCEAGTSGKGIAKLVESGCVRKLIISWGGNLTCLTSMVENGQLEIEFNPQGTLVERIRAAGFGLGGVLTPVGLGTIIEEKRWGERVRLNGRDWLYHTPLKADVTLSEAYMADEFGNIVFRRTQNNFNQVMCTASNLVIAYVVKPIMKIGSLDPDIINVPGNFVDILVQGGAT